MKEERVIPRAVVSFSISISGDQSFAIFGGIDSDSIVGGESAIKYFGKYTNDLNTWALEGQGIRYGDQSHKIRNSVPAIIDTGSS